jgi:hypothetical protein
MGCIMLVKQRESWVKQWELGDVPTLARLGVTVSSDLRQQWRDNWQSEGWRMAKGMEMLCSWLEWRDKKPA